MIDADFQIYVNALYVLLISSILALIVVIRTLHSSEVPVTSIRFYNLYFIVGVIGWIGLWLKGAEQIELSLTISVIFYVVCSLFLLVAVAECAQSRMSRKIIFGVHALIVTGGLFLDSDSSRIFFIAIYTLLIYPFVLYFSFKRALFKKNIGNGIIGVAALLVLLIVPIQLYNLFVSVNLNFAYGVSLIGSSTGFVLVGIGFLTSVLVNEHKQLSVLALKDPLTGLFNRRGMDYTLNIPLASGERSDKCLSAIAVDIDYFKKINDTYGHDGGDFVLKEIATVLLNYTRPSDVCCRFGGEEFVIVMPETDIDSAALVAERVRENIEKLQLAYDERVIRLTSSFGVATHCGHVDIDYLLKDADKSLYAAKAEGRNRVRVSDKQIMT